jgi:hypothetical protein
VSNSEYLEDNDIRELFDRMACHFDGADDGIRKMFSLLVETTLKYRDVIWHSRGQTLSVGETKEALGIFMDVLKTQRLAEDIDPKIKGLIMMWLEGLKKRIQN